MLHHHKKIKRAPTTKAQIAAMPKRKLNQPPQAVPRPDESATDPGDDGSDTEVDSNAVSKHLTRRAEG